MHETSIDGDARNPERAQGRDAYRVRDLVDPRRQAEPLRGLDQQPVGLAAGAAVEAESMTKNCSAEPAAESGLRPNNE